jgi:very-short-patch-repair endonuclease
VLEKPALNPFEVDVRDTLARRGLKLTAQYGTSGYWLDYAVQHPVQPGRYVLAIECDGASYHSSESARDRDRLRQEQLERLGWRFHRIWSSEWFHNKDRCVDKVLAAYELAVAALDRTDNEETDDAARVRRTINEKTRPLPAAVEDAGVAPQAARTQPRPPLRRGLQMTDYSQSQLVRMIRWIESDDRLRTEEELLEETMRELGFQKRGSRIVTAINQAIRQARR